MTGILRTAALRAGGLHLIRSLGRTAVRILLYHRFPAATKRQLEAQCAHLRRHYNVVSLDDVASWLCRARSLPPNSLAVTVDDGYRDFFDTAYPVFSAYRIPVTVFLTTGFLDRCCWLWVDELSYMFSHTSLRQVEVQLPDGARTFPLANDSERDAAAKSVKAAVKMMTNTARLTFIREELPAVLRIGVPAECPDTAAPLSWGQVREMAANGITFGAHTQTHPILSSISDEVELQGEIVGSKRRIEEELHIPVRHFSYPNGTWCDITPKVVAAVRHSGVACSVVAFGGVNVRTADPFLLRRNPVEPQTPATLFARIATGYSRC